MRRNKNGIPFVSGIPRTTPFDRAQVRPWQVQCCGKVRYQKRYDALEVVRLSGPEMRSYNCPWCYQWHVGHSKDTLVTTAHIPARRRS